MMFWLAVLGYLTEHYWFAMICFGVWIWMLAAE